MGWGGNLYQNGVKVEILGWVADGRMSSKIVVIVQRKEEFKKLLRTGFILQSVELLRNLTLRAMNCCGI